MNDREVDDLVSQIDSALTQLSSIMADPAMLHFESVHPSIERLEKVFELKAAIDAAFAWAADLNEAGFKVGSSRVVDYLMKALDISRTEATARLRRGRALYDPPAPPPADPEPEPESPASAEEKAREQEAARERDERERKAQEQARKRQASAEKRAVIDAELKNLDPHATPGHAELLNQALAYAESNSVGILRHWLREKVREANTSIPGPKAHNVAFNRRYVSLGEADEHGGVRLSGYLPADMAAQVSEALNPARSNVLEGTDLETTEGMSFGKKRAHLLVAMSRNFLNGKAHNLKGVGSIVVSMTLEELENMTPGDLFPTNTGHLVDPFALIRLGEARNDAFVIHAQDGQPLYAGTGKRTASLMHRIALFATELVCSGENCDRPMSECEAHHIVAHAKGGLSIMDNFTFLCWGHHRDNNDDRNPVSPFGWADRDEETNRAGHRRCAGAPVILNENPAAQRSGAAKIRARNRSKAKEPPPEAEHQPDLFDLPV